MKPLFSNSILPIMAFFAGTSAQAANDHQRDETLVVTAQSPSKQDSALLSKLIQKNSERRQKDLEDKILELNTSLEKMEQTRNKSLQEVAKQHRNRIELVLSELLSPETPVVASAEAHFKLATLRRSEEPRNARDLLKIALEKLEGKIPDNRELAANILVSSAELSLESGNFKTAQREFLRAADLLKDSSPDTQILRMHALLGWGDTLFNEFRFEAADSAYKQAESTLKKANFATKNILEPYRGPLLVRRFWANFRAGQYNTAAELASAFAHQRPLFEKELSSFVTESVVRSTGVTLAEVSDFAATQKIVENPVCGELGKEMAVASLQALMRSGRYEELEIRAQKLEAFFASSPSLLEFLSVRWEAAKQNNKPMLAENLVSSIPAKLARQSLWKTTTQLNDEQDKKRSHVVIVAAEEAYSLAMQEGQKNGQALSFQRAYNFVQLMLQESDETLDRGGLHLRASQTALLAGNLKNAEEQARTSLTFALDNAKRKSAHNQLVEATRRQALANNSYFTSYLNAVDAFARAYPEDAAAKLALFESARSLEAKGQTAAARTRLERLLATAETATPFDNSEKERVVLALLALNARDTDTSRAAVAVADLERQLAPDDLPPSVFTKIQTENAKAIRSHTSALRENGKLAEAANALMLWSVEHGDNPETPFLLRDAAQSFLELGELSKTREASDLLVKNFPKHELVGEALFWKGRSLESDLAFSAAANAYVAAAFNNTTRISKSQRIDALTRAQIIFSDLKEHAWSARLLEKIASLRKKSGSDEQQAQQTLAIAKAYSDAQLYENSERLFSSVMKNKMLNSKLRWQAELNLIETRIKWGRSVDGSRTQLHDLASHIKTVTTGDLARQTRPIVRQAVILALQTDLARITELPLTWDATMQQQQAQTVSKIANHSSEMYQFLNGDKSAEDIQTASLLLAKIRKEAADFHSRVASNKKLNNRLSDALAQKAERFRIAARQAIFSGLSENTEQRANAALTLQALGTPTELRTEPTLAMIEPAFQRSTDVVRTVLEKRLRTEEKP